jgi:hypothetical protein
MRSEGLDAIANWVGERRRQMERRLDRLGEMLAEEDRAAQKGFHKGTKGIK